VTRATQPVVYFTTGHGERDLTDGGNAGFSVLKTWLERDGFQVKTLLLAVTNTVPSDAGVVVIGGPHTPFQPAEVDTLRAYMARGGRLMAMVDSSMDTPDRKLGDAGLNSLLGEWGITLRNDMGVDAVSSLSTDPRVLVVQQYGTSPITTKFVNTITAFPLARSLVLTQSAQSNLSLVSLAETSDQSWGLADLEAVANAMKTGRLPGPGPQDAKGPLVIAATSANSQTGTRLVVFGTSSFVTNPASQQFGSNFDLVLNGVNWLAEQESQITIRPKPSDTRQIIPSVGLMIQVFSVSVVLMPLAVLVAGLIVWWRRR
jgi:ABC-2 type transport system permease protein